MNSIYSGPEALETRIAPAGLVTVTFSHHGVLELSGDAEANRIDVIKTSGALQITDLGDGDTQFKYRGELLDLVTINSPIRKFEVLAESGVAKTLSVHGLTTSRSVGIALADGSEVTLDSVNIGGALGIGPSGHLGSLRLTGDVVKIGGVLSVENVGSVIADPRVLNVAKAITLLDSPDVMLIPEQKLKVVRHGLQFSHHSESASLTVRTDRLRIAEDIQFSYNPKSAREVSLAVESRLDGSVGGIKVYSDSRRVGRPDLTSISFQLAGNISVGNMTLVGTEGASSMELAGAIDVRGDLNVSLGHGATTLETKGLKSLRVTGDTQIFASGDGKALELTAQQSLDFGGKFFADFQGGDFSFLVAAPAIATHDLAKIGGSANSLTATIRSDQLVMEQRLTFRNDHDSLPAASELHLESSELTLAGGLRYRGTFSREPSAGADRVFIETANLLQAGLVDMKAGQAMTEFHFDAARGESIDRLKFVNRSGESVVALGLNVADVGPTILKLGGGAASVSIDNGGAADRAHFAGLLRIESAGDTDIRISNAEIASVRIDGGNGTDRISIEGSKFLGAFVATLGAGDDSFVVETEDQLGSTAFRGLVLVHLGDGDDTLALGSDAPRSALKFVGQAFFEGGAGLDTVGSISSAIKGIAPVIAGFEVAP